MFNRPARIALAGHPNCGKTSLFNALTGARQHVANYPGITVEKRTGMLTLSHGRQAEVVDLPGTYSLNGFTPEERVAAHELFAAPHKPDVVVFVADSTQLRRHLVLLAQLRHSGAHQLVLCLNMADEARAAGQIIDVAQLEQRLGCAVIETVAPRGTGIAALRRALDRAIAPALAHHKQNRDTHKSGTTHSGTTHSGTTHSGTTTVDGADAARLASLEGAYAWVDALLDGVVRQAPASPGARRTTAAIDAVVAHRWLGLPIFAVVMYAIFWLTFRVGEYPMSWIEHATAALRDWVSSWWSPAAPAPLLRSLLVDGLIAGVGGVLVFVPNIALLFGGLALLEDSGYLARAAFLTDRVMQRFGLHGKSFVPLLMGLGCSVPGIMATRTLEHERDRLTTMLVLPLIPCGARLPIWMLLIPAFFPPAWRAPMLWFIYAFGLVLALLLALLLRRTLLRGADAPFVLELPPYRLPTPRSVLLKMVRQSLLYLRKAGGLILAISILLWAATTFPRLPATTPPATVVAPSAATAAAGAAERLQYSAAGRLGHTLEPLVAPLGFDWKIVTAMLGAVAAKELFVAQMGIIYALHAEPDAPDTATQSLRTQLARDYSPLVGFNLMLFLLIAMPCMSTLVATRRESGKWRWAVLQLVGLTALAYGLTCAIFQLGQHL